MNTLIVSCTILGVISGLSEGSSLLEDGPLNASVGGAVMFRTNRPPTEEPFQFVLWDFNNNERSIITSLPTQNTTGPEYEGRITLFTSTGSLELRNLTLRDSGVYGVSILPVGENTQVGSTRLDVYEPVDNVIVTPSTADVVEFSSVSVFCSSSGSFLSFLWMKGSSEITANDRIQLNRTDGGSYLTILSVTQYDQGNYTCQVSNPANPAKKDSMTLLVNYGPENTQLSVSPSEEPYEEGSDITLSCSSESRPPAEFTWFLNGEKMSHSGPELKLMKVQMSQKGSYTCRAFNHITKRDQKSQPREIVVNGCMSSQRVSAGSIAGILVASFVLFHHL